MNNTNSSASPARAWIITGPTSGIGRRTALELARHGTVVLVGRDRAKLSEVETEIRARPGGRAVSVICDFSDIQSVRRAAAEIAALGLPLAGLLNNAGIMPMRAGRSAQGWDLAFAVNHLGPFAFTEALLPCLPDGANVVFTCSGVEDPERKPAVTAGFRGGRYISAEASARGEWAPGGSSRPGYDAYATSKQGNLATVFTLAREVPRLRFNAVEPGFNPSTGLARDANAALQFLAKYVLGPMAPFIKYWSTPKRAARVLTNVLTSQSDSTGVYYDENGKPMKASAQVSDPAFAGRYIAETRALLATVPADGSLARRGTLTIPLDSPGPLPGAVKKIGMLMTTEALPSVGFIGLGDQGLPMAVAIGEAGFPLHVWARRPGTIDALTDVPHVRHENTKELAAASDIVALCVSTDEDVAALVTGGLLDGLRPGSVVVNHGTGTPGNAARLAEICAAAGVEALDAPVSGGRTGAEARALTTMVGGPEPAAQKCEPVFRSFSRDVYYLGAPGSGQLAKLLNNMLMAMNHASNADILEIAVRLGQDPIRLTEVLRKGSAANTALAMLPLNSTIDPDAPETRSPLEYLTLDMHLFSTAMTEAGIDAGSVTARGLSGASRLPDVLRMLNPKHKEQLSS